MLFEQLVNFNSSWVISQTLEQFIEHEKHHGLSDKKMKEIYDFCKKKGKSAEKPAV